MGNTKNMSKIFAICLLIFLISALDATSINKMKRGSAEAAPGTVQEARAEIRNRVAQHAAERNDNEEEHDEEPRGPRRNGTDEEDEERGSRPGRRGPRGPGSRGPRGPRRNGSEEVPEGPEDEDE